MLKLSIGLLIITLFSSSSVLANNESNIHSEDNFLLDLQADMQAFTDIATATKQNVDYMPYVISTLHYEELSKLGITSLREALKLVPGVDLSVGMAGVKNPIFRGSNPYSFGQSKLIINGVVMNDQVFGAYNQYLEMPIDVIHRIEVVRGSGSLVGHVNGYAGSIHVITKSDRDDGEPVQNEGFVGLGTHDSKLIGGVFGYQKDDLSFSTDLYLQRHNLTLESGKDRFMRDGELNEELSNYQLGLNLNYQKLSVKGRFSSNDSGVSLGKAFSLTNDSSDFLKVDNNALDISYHTKISNQVEMDFTIGYLDEHRTLQDKVVPNGGMMMGMGMLPQGMYFVVDFSERTYKQHLKFGINSIENHEITTGLYLSQSEIINNDAGNSFDNLNTIIYSDLFTNESRDYTSLYAEDLINLNERTTLQLGVKLEAYSDVDTQLSPRAAIVYRYDDENIYKLMYSHAYREPSWREQYTNASLVFYRPNANLDVELVDAYEMAYIHKFSTRSNFKINMFHLENRDQMQADTGMDTFENKDQNTLYGFETEYNRTFDSGANLALSYSFVEGDNVGDVLANTSSQMATAYYIHPINTDWSLSALYKFVGVKERIAIDARDKVSAYSTLDLAAQYVSKANGLTMTVGVKNAIDESVVFPAPVGTYVKDFEQDGRSFFLRLKKEF